MNFGRATRSWKRFLNIAAVVSVHGACVAAFWTGGTLNLILLALGSFLIRMFGITAGYHRYFSHRAFKTGRIFQFVLAWIGCASAQKGPLWWAAHHRSHHQDADGPNDLHSPVRRGFFWSHMGWWLSDLYEETDIKKIPDFAAFPELVWVNKYFLLPPLSWGLLCWFLAGWDGVIWGFFISTVVLWHATFFINSLAHLIGTRRYPTPDQSRNNFWLALITLGEGWHNNHHYFPSSVNQGFYWWEIDISLYVLRFLRFFGLVSDFRFPPERVLALGQEIKTLHSAQLRPN